MNIEKMQKSMDNFICPVCGEDLYPMFDMEDTFKCLECDYVVSDTLIRIEKTMEMIK